MYIILLYIALLYISILFDTVYIKIVFHICHANTIGIFLIQCSSIKKSQGIYGIKIV